MAENVYEMLWDCEYCGQKKLLGKTHRFCPGCGAPQNPEKRYFPSDADKVLAKDHVYFGADKVCPHCKNAVSARMKFCSQCGGGMDGSAAVRRVGEPAPCPAPAASGGLPLLGKAAIGLALAAVALAAALFSCRKSVALSVTGHGWVREIAVERYGAARESAWCDELPAGAYDIDRRREVRDHRQVSDGQTCRTVKSDQGDGTFVEKEECEARTRSEPVYADKCRYAVDAWRPARSEKSSGGGLDGEPAWPAVRLAREGQCRGCEREGARTETYTVRFSAEGKEYSCDFPDEAKWRSFAPGSRWSGKATLGGRLVCAGLAP